MTDPLNHNRRRTRQMHRLFISGVLLAVVATVVTAFLGVSGGGGAAVFFLIVALSAVVAAFTGFGFAMADEIRRQPVALSRVGMAIGYFAVAAMSMVATVGAASTVASGS